MRLAAWADRRHLVSIRAAVMLATVWMTVYATVEAFRLAYISTLPGIELAAVIAAITAPLCAMQAAVFKWYMDSKKGE